MREARKGGARPINLALQGGGAHGALTWGVLDRLLEDGRLAIRGVSGTSAGAMNAVVLADGYRRGGPEGARAALGAVLEGGQRGGAVLADPAQRLGPDVGAPQPRLLAGLPVHREPQPRLSRPTS